jgi:septin family protein
MLNPTAAGANSRQRGMIGFGNVINQIHRDAVRQGFQFTIMVVGMFLHKSYSLSLLVQRSSHC